MPKNLNEEIKRMRSLFNFKVGDNAHDVLSEQNIHDSLIKEQQIEVNAKPGGLSGEIGLGIVRNEKGKKASNEDISNYGKESLGPDIKKIVESGTNRNKIDLSLSEANQISVALIDLALTNKKVKRTFKIGLGNGSLTVRKVEPDSFVKVSVLGKNVSIGTLVRGITRGAKDTDEIPKNIILYVETADEGTAESFSTISEMAEYITSENIKLFSQKKPTTQWYLSTWKPKTGGKSKGQPEAQSKGVYGNLIISKGPIAMFNGIPVLNMIAPSTKGGDYEGSTKKGKPEEFNIELRINLTETFETGVSEFEGPDEDIITNIRNQINAQLHQKGFTNIVVDDVDILSSASNFWGDYVAPSHPIGSNTPYSPGEKDLSGEIIPANNNNYTSAPSGTEAKDKNNKLAWDRGQRFVALLNSIEGEESFSINDPDYSVSWRVSDTKGENDKPGCKIGHCGQFATIVLKGRASKYLQTPDKKTPGSKYTHSAQYGLVLSAEKTPGGITLFSWFGARQSKYLDKNGDWKKNPKTGRPFSGLPKWLDSIIYK